LCKSLWAGREEIASCLPIFLQGSDNMLDLDNIFDIPREKIDFLIKIIQGKRNSVKKAGLYINEIVREDIFGILEYYCTVVFYPLPPEEENDGFHITMPVDYKKEGEEEHFVFLNTAKPLEKQVFAAAHELGHIWVDLDKFWDTILGKEFLRNHDNEEAVMNRFAAELLMPYSLFRQSADERLRKFVKEDHGIYIDDAFRVIASLMDEFCVPAQAVICRFYETGLMKKEICKQLLAGPIGEISVEKYRKYADSLLEECIQEGSYTKLLKATNKRGIKDFPEVLSAAEQKGVFSLERVAQLREMLKIPKIEGLAELIDVGETE